MNNRTAVITGATSGIGAAFAKRFAAQGYDLILTGRRKEKIEAFAEQLRNTYGAQAIVVLAELSEPEGVQKVIEQMQDKPVEILVNNAGFGANFLYQDCDLTQMEQLAKVNVLAPMELIHAVLPGMVKRGSGTIINISSEGAFIVIPKNAVYAGAKSFLKSFTEGLHLDLMGTGVKVLAVCPGLTHTDFHERIGIEKAKQIDHGPIRWMSPEQIVDASLKALDKNQVVCIPGSHTRRTIRMLRLLPRNTYYQMMANFGKKSSGKKTAG